MNKVVIEKLAGLVEGSQMLQVYEYFPSSCNWGTWTTGSNAVKDAVAEAINLELPGTSYLANKDEDLMINAAFVQVNFATGDVSYLSKGLQIIDVWAKGDRFFFGLNGGFDTRQIHLSEGDSVTFPPLTYGGNFDICPDTNTQVLLILSDKMTPLNF